MKGYSVLILLLLPFSLIGQIITTFAGGGTGSLGDGGLATAASLKDPRGGTFDKYGNYYVADGLGENRIRKVSTTGIITTIAGNGTGGFGGDLGSATSALLNAPIAVKLDNKGNIYIADFQNNRIRKVDAITGIISTVAGCSDTGGYNGDNIPATTAMLYNPTDICFDQSGNLYIADAANSRIRKVDTSGIITTYAGIGIAGNSGDNGPASVAKIATVEGLAIDDTGNLYLTSLTLVRKINNIGIITTVAGIASLSVYTNDGLPATSTPINPWKLAIDRLGQLVIADWHNYRVYRVNLDGILYTIAGNGVEGFSGDNGPATEAEFDYPGGVAFDSCGNLYIADVQGRVRKVSFNPACWPENVPQVATNEAVVYPNPATSEINIELKTQTKYALINITGIIEQSGTLKEGNNNINIERVPPAVYMLVLTDNEGGKTVRKMVNE